VNEEEKIFSKFNEEVKKGVKTEMSVYMLQQ